MAKKVVVIYKGMDPKVPLEERLVHEIRVLSKFECTIVEPPSLHKADIVDVIRDADAVITHWGIPIDGEIISAMDRCAVIGLASIGSDMVDIEAATQRGIVVTNVPDVFVDEVADHTMALILAAARRLKLMDKMACTGQWAQGRPTLSAVPRLFGQTLGLLSFGSVARAVAARAKVFGLRIISHDPYISETTMTSRGVEPVGLWELLERSDYLSVHVPLNKETHHMIGDGEIRAMKPTAVIINTSRGGVIDEDALLRAIQEGRLAGAALDVLEVEPPDPENPLLSMPNVVITPHVASASSRMWPATRERAAHEVSLVLRGLWPMSCVNPQLLPRTPLRRWQPHAMERGPSG